MAWKKESPTRMAMTLPSLGCELRKFGERPSLASERKSQISTKTSRWGKYKPEVENIGELHFYNRSGVQEFQRRIRRSW